MPENDAIKLINENRLLKAEVEKQHAVVDSIVQPNEITQMEQLLEGMPQKQVAAVFNSLKVKAIAAFNIVKKNRENMTAV